MKKLLLMFIISFFLASVSFSQNKEIFIGLPTAKVQSEADYTEKFTLNEEQAEIARCVISLKNNSYYWTSRGNVEMRRYKSGIYDIYLATKGQGYVKDEKSGKYMEHMHIGLKTITYWGKVQKSRI